MTDVSNQARWAEDRAPADAIVTGDYTERTAVLVRFAAGLPTYGPNSQTTFGTPTLGSLSPSTGLHGAPNVVMTATGTGFTEGTTVMWGLVDLSTEYVSATSVKTTIPLSQSIAGTVAVKVRNGPNQSSAVNFTVT